MSKRWDRADVRLTTDIGPTSDASAVAEDTPFVVGVLGYFTARRETSVSVTVCKPVEIDRDNFDAVMERLNIKFEASLDSTLGPEAGGWSGALVLRQIDSFHPDEILKQIEPLRTLVELRRALENPAKFSAAAGEIQKRVKTSARPAEAPGTQTPSNLLQTILEAASPSAAATPRKERPSDIERLVQTIVSPHAIRLDEEQQQQLIAAVDAVLGERLKAILHDAEFQRLEAAWRSLRFLVMNAETGSALKIYLLNLSKAELANDMMRSRDLSDSDLFKALSSFASGSGGQPWGVLVGYYALSRSAEDIHILD